jgi:cytochrome bd-type quinol oxidase subunit 2
MAVVPMGIALCVLALAGSGGIVPPPVALGIALAALLAATLLSLRLLKEMDELAREMSRECASLSYYLLLLVGGGWAMLAHLGFVAGPAPLDWMTMFLGLPLLAAFIAAGRKGLIQQR